MKILKTTLALLCTAHLLHAVDWNINEEEKIGDGLRSQETAGIRGNQSVNSIVASASSPKEAADAIRSTINQHSDQAASLITDAVKALCKRGEDYQKAIPQLVADTATDLPQLSKLLCYNSLKAAGQYQVPLASQIFAKLLPTATTQAGKEDLLSGAQEAVKDNAEATQNILQVATQNGLVLE